MLARARALALEAGDATALGEADKFALAAVMLGLVVAVGEPLAPAPVSAVGCMDVAAEIEASVRCAGSGLDAALEVDGSEDAEGGEMDMLGGNEVESEERRGKAGMAVRF